MNPSRNLARIPAFANRISSCRNAAKHAERAWQILTIAAVAALSWWYVVVHRQPSANGYRVFVVSIGVVGITLAILAAALSVRKRMAYQGLGRMSLWLTGHIYIGLMATFAIFLHTELRAGSTLTTLLLTCFALTVVSGLLGWWLSKKLPPLLTAIEESPAILEDLLSVRTECLQGMLELAHGGSPEFGVFVHARLMKDASSWRRMFRFYRRRSTLAQELPAFQKEHAECLANLRWQEHRAFQRAVEYALRINKMNSELLLQRVLRAWPTIHIVSMGAMFALVTVHIFVALYF